MGWFASGQASGYGSGRSAGRLERRVSDIFQEIDEELRRENFAKLWERYGRYVIIIAILVVIAVAAGVEWRAYQQSRRRAEGVRYTVALDLARQGKNKEAAEAFAVVAKEAGGGHAVLARFEEAAAKARLGDNSGAIAVYDALAGDGSVDSEYRDAATLLAAEHRLKDGNPKDVIDHVAPLIAAGNPWRPTALELTALAQLKGGNKAEARTTYQHLVDDLSVPQGLRARAAEMVTALAE